MPREKGVCRARQSLLPPRRNVAMAIDYQGDHDDKLTVVFIGVCSETLCRLFDYLCAGGRGLADGYSVEHQTPPYRRQGYCYHRLAVILEGYHERFASPTDVLLLCQAWLTREYCAGGTADAYELDVLLNLSGRDERHILKLS